MKKSRKTRFSLKIFVKKNLESDETLIKFSKKSDEEFYILGLGSFLMLGSVLTLQRSGLI